MSSDDPTVETDPAGEELGRAMAALVADVEAPAELRARVGTEVETADRRRARLAGLSRRQLAAAVVAVALLGGALVLAGTGDGASDRDLVTAADSDARPPVVTVPTSPPPTVLGATITRPPEPDPEPEPEPEPVPEPAPVETAPPTTVLVCRDSVDPACGDFHWDPAPEVPQATARIILPAEAPVAGQPYSVTVEVTDPATQPTFVCGTGDYDPWPLEQEAFVGLAIDGCYMYPPSCPARYGPWTPPPWQGGTIEGTMTMTFPAPGTYTIGFTAAGPRSNCPNVDPYGTSATAERVTVEVLE